MKIVRVVLGVVVVWAAVAGIWWWIASTGAQHERARRESCVSNLKQLALGALGYAQDWDEHFPLTPPPGGDWVSRQGVGLRDRLLDPRSPNAGPLVLYVESTLIVWCPSDRMHVYPCGSYLWNNDLCGKSVAEGVGKPLVWDHEPWHSRGRNVAMTDGKVSWLRQQDFEERMPQSP